MLCWLNSLLVVILHNLPDHMLFAFQNQKTKQMSTLNYSSDEKAFVRYAFDIFRQVIVSNADELEMLNGNAFAYLYAGKLGWTIRKWYNSKQGNHSSSFLYPDTHVCLDELVLMEGGLLKWLNRMDLCLENFILPKIFRPCIPPTEHDVLSSGSPSLPHSFQVSPSRLW